MPLDLPRIEAKPKEMPDYRERVLKMLAEEASWPSKLAKDIAEQEGMVLNRAKIRSKQALKTLAKRWKDREAKPKIRR